MNQSGFKKALWKTVWILLMLAFGFLLSLHLAVSCLAQKQRQTAVYDTIYIDNRCVRDIIVSEDGKKTYAVYNDGYVSDFVTIPKATSEYLALCKKYNVEPCLAIRLRNKKIYSLIKVEKTYEGR